MNNYDLSMSNKLWDKPEDFSPERFLQNGRILKPDHFIPFGAGRRSCMGYKMVQLICFSMLSNVMHNFTIAPIEGHTYKVKIGSLAMPVKAYEFNLVPRCWKVIHTHTRSYVRKNWIFADVFKKKITVDFVLFPYYHYYYYYYYYY